MLFILVTVSSKITAQLATRRKTVVALFHNDHTCYTHVSGLWNKHAADSVYLGDGQSINVISLIT